MPAYLPETQPEPALPLSTMEEATNCGWLGKFQEQFSEELHKRLNNKTFSALGKARMFVWCADWAMEEMRKRQLYKRGIHLETSIEVLRDPEFKKRVTGKYSYNLTGNDAEVEIFEVNSEQTKS